MQYLLKRRHTPRHTSRDRRDEAAFDESTVGYSHDEDRLRGLADHLTKIAAKAEKAYYDHSIWSSDTDHDTKTAIAMNAADPFLSQIRRYDPDFGFRGMSQITYSVRGREPSGRLIF